MNEVFTFLKDKKNGEDDFSLTQMNQLVVLLNIIDKNIHLKSGEIKNFVNSVGLELSFLYDFDSIFCLIQQLVESNQSTEKISVFF